MGRPIKRAAIIAAAILFAAGMFSDTAIRFCQAQDSAPSRGALQYGQSRELCNLKDSEINESSGIAASIRYPGLFWTQNDSGDSARVFLINKSCETIAVVKIKGVIAVDWEDLASFRMGKDSYVLIADTGNNTTRRERFPLYVIREPELQANPDGKTVQTIEVDPEWTIPFSYEDGPHDCEAVAVDSAESTIYLASKRLDECKIYSLPIPSKESKQPNVAKAIAALGIRFVTAMDISPDGKHAVVLTYSDGYAFDREKGESWTQAFSRDARVVKMPQRKQGEAICYGTEGKALYLTSENPFQPLWEIPVIEENK